MSAALAQALPADATRRLYERHSPRIFGYCLSRLGSREEAEAAHDLDALQDVIASPERGAAVSVGELTRALGAIPARQRRALLLREFEGHSYEEIASELGVSVAAVETLIFRARRAVAQQLEQSGATSRTQRGAAASVVELFRWFFGGAAAPLKLAAVQLAEARCGHCRGRDDGSALGRNRT